MKNLKRFENFEIEGFETKEDLIEFLSTNQRVYDLEDLESMNIDQLKNLYSEMENAKESDMEDQQNEANWIKDAIKRPGSLRRKLHKKNGEKISMHEIDSELHALKSKDIDKKKPGLQLSKSNRTKQKQLVLAKNLRKINEDEMVNEEIADLGALIGAGLGFGGTLAYLVINFIKRIKKAKSLNPNISDKEIFQNCFSELLASNKDH